MKQNERFLYPEDYLRWCCRILLLALFWMHESVDSPWISPVVKVLVVALLLAITWMPWRLEKRLKALPASDAQAQARLETLPREKRKAVLLMVGIVAFCAVLLLVLSR